MKTYFKYLFWTILLLPTIWLINTVWYKPFDIDDFYERLVIQHGLEQPEEMSRFKFWKKYGIDFYNDELSDISVETSLQRSTRLKRDFEMLRSYKRSKQTPSQVISTDVLDWYLENEVHQYLLYKDYHYAINHIDGAHLTLPFFMASSHQIKDYADADDYILRMSKFEKYFEQLISKIIAQEDSGLVMPNFIIDNILVQVSDFIREKPQQNILYVDFSKKIDKLPNITPKIKSDLTNQVRNLLETIIYPSYQKLIRTLDEIRENRQKNEDNVGIWRFAEGHGYYNFMLRKQTNDEISSEELYQLGLIEIDSLTYQMQLICNQLDFDKTKNVGECLKSLSQDSMFSYQNKTKEELVKDIKTLVHELEENLSYIFETKPRTKLIIQTVPPFKEKYAPNISYQNFSLDGNSAAISYLNLSKKNNWRKFENRALVCKEILLGRHFPTAIQREASILPTFRRILSFDAFNEGWAYYSLHLAKEYGYFKTPYDQLGMLHLCLVNAVSMVVDIGIHTKKWSREQAIDYFRQHTGLSDTEISYLTDLAIIYPARACSYYTGYQQIISLKEKTQNLLGEKYNNKDFHEILLQNGAVPLNILSKIINSYIERVKNEKF
ncbi:DUF885 domain-containing protein [Thermoflexibacter ruber]|uniref:Uncharacterized conserved protein, DUF885 familyt n=1 Tax=Thermoflexibacter ruber TaxID=1003 RepID=A0A1I2JIG0_9BACT|nr:DUF885 domain-containing protein [Thermoflexibacter ruber]SFF52471.1 Uncharacterized conserved protein, DUF885 familyt [Thermoflexibacter ruber]